jgi:hypothetical protein
MSRKSDPDEELTRLRREVTDLNESIEQYIENKPQQERFARAERTQIGVAIALITIFISFRTADIIAISEPLNACLLSRSGFDCAFGSQAFLAVIFLLIKTSTMTLRPIASRGSQDGIVVKKIDEYWLPAFYVALLIAGVISGVGFTIFGNLEILLFTEIYISIELLVLLTVGQVYAQNYEESMARIYSGGGSSPLTVSRGPGGSVDAFHIENKDSRPYKKKEIKFIVDAPDTIEVNLDSQAYQSPDKENVWVYVKQLDPGQSRRVPMTVKSNRREETPTTTTFTITPVFDGEKQDPVEFEATI